MDRPLYLDMLQKGREKRGVVVRVVRKWTAKDNNGDGAPLYVAMIFADSKGSAMYAEIPRGIIAVKEYLFQVDLIYLIKKFRVNNAKPYYKPFDATLMIELTEFSTVELIRNAPASIPRWIYSITPFSSIVPVTGPVYKYIDVLGYLTRYTAVSSFVPKNKEKVTILRELYLKDLRDEEIKVTLWGDHAINFTIDHVYDKNSGNLVVCLIVGCIPRRLYNDRTKVYLSGSAACVCYFNPEITEATHFHSKFKDKPVYIECPVENEVASSSELQDKPLQTKTIAELDKIDPFDFEDGSYKCTVTITSVPEDVAWWYRSCVPCKKKAERQADQRYRCPKCLGYNIIPRYILSFTAQDATAGARFFAYDDEARLIVQKDCDALLATANAGTTLPQPLQKIIGQKYTFGIDLTDDACRGPLSRQYLVKSVLERPTRQIITPPSVTSQRMTTESIPSLTESPLSAVESTKEPQDQSGHDLGLQLTTATTPASNLQIPGDLQKIVGSSHQTTARKRLFDDVTGADKEARADLQVLNAVAPEENQKEGTVDAADHRSPKRSNILQTAEPQTQ